MIHLLENLAIAVAQAINGKQIHAMESVATELENIKTLPAWLPETDFRFYLGLAQFYSHHFEAAEATLSAITPDSIGAAEAHWILIQIKCLTKENQKRQLSQIFEHYQQIAQLYPYSPIMQYVANAQTDQHEAALGTDSELWSMPAFEIGRFYEWQTLITVGDLYYEQNLFQEAANAYHWSIQVRDLYEWLENALIAEMWVKMADCYKQKGKKMLAARHLAKSFALPLTTLQISQISTRLNTLLESNEMPEPGSHKPDAQKLRQIGDRLFEMEMFDEAITAYKQAEQQGADMMQTKIASVLEAKAQFLFDYRSERTSGTVLFGMPLSWEKVAQAYENAKQSYVKSQNSESILGIQRCNKALALANLKKSNKPYDFLNNNNDDNDELLIAQNEELMV